MGVDEANLLLTVMLGVEGILTSSSYGVESCESGIIKV